MFNLAHHLKPLRILTGLARTALSIHSWQTLKIIGGSFLSSFTIAVPLFGYLIFFGSYADGTYKIDFLRIGNLSFDVGGQFDFIKLKLTYVGLSVIGFTSIIFKIFCPNEVARYRDGREYVESSVATSHPNELEHQLLYIRSVPWYRFAIVDLEAARSRKIEHNDSSQARKAHNGGKSSELSREDWLDKNLNTMNSIYSTRYQIRNLSLFPLRTVILIGYLAGFWIALIPSAQVFSRVAQDAKVYLQKEYFSTVSASSNL